MKFKILFEMLMWLPFVLFIFLASFLITKFLFIFFLNAAFTPLFIFELTPLFLLPGMNNLQLLFTSLPVVLFDAYLHTTDKSKHLRYSFIPTWIMISGIGIAIIKQPGSLDNGIRYILFAFLLIATLIDHRILLVMPEQMFEKKSFFTPSIISDKKVSSSIRIPFTDSKTTLQREPSKISPISPETSRNIGYISKNETLKTISTKPKRNVFFIKKIGRYITKNIHLPKKNFKSKPYYDTRYLKKHDTGGNMEESVDNNITEIKKTSLAHSVEEIKSKETDSTSKIINNLIIGINKEGEIIQFNKECQKITGYTRGEVLRRRIYDLLIPKHSYKQWEKMLNLSIIKSIDNFKLPWKTRDGNEILISWSSFPLETKEGTIRSICFIGKKIGINAYDNISYESHREKLYTEIKPQESKEWMEEKNNKKTIFEEETSGKVHKNFDDSKEVVFTEVEKPIMSNFSESYEIREKINDLLIKYDLINKKIRAIENQTDKSLLEKKLSNLNEKFNRIGKDEFEIKSIEDRKNLDKRIAEFRKYKEKLIELETEIEKRRNNVIEQEKNLKENILDKQSFLKKDNLVQEENINYKEDNLNLNEILQSAAIMRRGVLKQINSSFAELTGFETDELVNRDFIDFIAPEGLANAEQYYLNRLKGIGDHTYNTIFSTKNRGKIYVKISIKPIIYRGEKAEIAIINKIKNQ